MGRGRPDSIGIVTTTMVLVHIKGFSLYHCSLVVVLIQSGSSPSSHVHSYHFQGFFIYIIVH